MRKLYALLCLSGLLSLSTTVLAQTTFPVRFSHGAEYFPQNFESIRQNPEAPTDLLNGYYIRYIQCAKIPAATERSALEASGVQFLGYIHFGAYQVALPVSFDINRLAAIHVRSVVPVSPDWKIANTLRERPWGAWAVNGNNVDINMQLYPQISIADGAELCRSYGITVVKTGNQNGFLQVRVDKDRIEQVAALPFIRYLELIPPPSEKEDTRGRSLHRSNQVDSDHALGKKFNGEGVSVLVRDDGPLGPHIDYQGRLINLSEDTGIADGTHGDGVGGIMAGSGNLDPTKKGMASGARVFAIDYVADFQDETLPLHLTENVTVTNSSYSNGCNAGYTLAAQTVDNQLFNYPNLMHVFSAGNSNNNDCSYGAGDQWGNITGGHKMAKNAIATANLLSNATLDNTSSRGPAHDGRLKPDISANGNSQESTDHNNTYQVFGGTSAAAPGIAGIVAQLTQAYREINNTIDAPTALIKASLLNTANDLGNVGPDFKFGWGHVNAFRALTLLEENQYLSGNVDQGGTATHQITIPAGVVEARLMVYWAEPSADVATERALINDLDLTVTTPGGGIELPWRLDPTPDPTILNLPAGKGRDSLNNVEQVLINNPAAGTYTININGFEVPQGPQDYYLLWEFRTEEIKITYPNGGEGLVPGTVERIHWDATTTNIDGTAGSFELRYSINDGASWNSLGTVSGTLRMFDWNVPGGANISGKVRVMVTRGAKSDMSDHAFSISPLPGNIQIVKVCPDSMTVSWSMVNDTLQYDVYLLGEKYMAIQGTTANTSYTFPIQNAGEEKWVAVRTSHPSGLTGRRSIAVRWEGELKDCQQPEDLGVRELLSPSGGAIVQCDQAQQMVKARLVNEGLNTISGAQLSYLVNNDAPVTEVVPDLAPGQTLEFEFVTPISINTNGVINLSVWSTLTGEDVFFNDTLRSSYTVVTQAATNYFTETFQSPTFPPLGWVVFNPDDKLTWSRTPSNIIGPLGTNTRALYVPFYSYSGVGEEDFINLIPLDFTVMTNPAISFEMAYAPYSQPGYEDGLRVEVQTGCDANAVPQIVWQKSGLDLATTGGIADQFFPSDEDQWRTELIDLNQFAGQKCIVRFVSTNAFGNNLFIDNINVLAYDANPPIAVINVPADTICRGDSLVYSANLTGTLTDYEWYFGTFAMPTTATGPGPHLVKYLTPGTRNVRLVTCNPIGCDTAKLVLAVLNDPTANFSVNSANLTVTFNNTSINADTYLWNFGDGNTSTEKNPVHTYTAGGTYQVAMTASNQCKDKVKILGVVLTTSTGELAEALGIKVLPNPNSGDFRVEFHAPGSEPVLLQLFDARGALISSRETVLTQGPNTMRFEGLNLPAGLYQLQVKGASGTQAFTVSVQ